jgi:hypothetical protein
MAGGGAMLRKPAPFQTSASRQGLAPMSPQAAPWRPKTGIVSSGASGAKRTFVPVQPSARRFVTLSPIPAWTIPPPVPANPLPSGVREALCALTMASGVPSPVR